jgi:hypothetical protein
VFAEKQFLVLKILKALSVILRLLEAELSILRCLKIKLIRGLFSPPKFWRNPPSAGVTGKHVFHAHFGIKIPNSGISPDDQNHSYGPGPKPIELLRY